MRFVQVQSAFAFEVVVEERKFNLLLEIGSCPGEGKYSHVLIPPLDHVPSAVAPGPHHERVLKSGILLFYGFVCLECSEEVFCVIPSSHGQDGRFDAAEMRVDRSRFPVGIIRFMRHGIIPDFIVLFEDFRRYIFQSAQP